MSGTAQLFDKFRAHYKARAALKQERLGQAFFNSLFFDHFDVNFAEQIRGGDLDPFYNDDRIPHLETMLKIRWQEPEPLGGGS